jgi:putative chitinase
MAALAGLACALPFYAMTIEHLTLAFPHATASALALYGQALIDAIMAAEINTPLRERHFLAQVGHECADLNHLSENLNYSAEALYRVWPTQFGGGLAAHYAHDPERIANRAYAGRMGNGAETSGDGWRFRGRGLIQITGRENYEEYSVAVGYNVVENPDILLSANELGPRLCVGTATWFWTAHHLNVLADHDDCESITRRVNGGLLGLPDRIARVASIKEALEVVA